MLCLVVTLCDPMDCSSPGSSVHGDSPVKNTGVGCHALLQEVFPAKGLNPGLPHCGRILYEWSHRERSHKSRRPQPPAGPALTPRASCLASPPLRLRPCSDVLTGNGSHLGVLMPGVRPWPCPRLCGWVGMRWDTPAPGTREPWAALYYEKKPSSSKSGGSAVA